MSVCCECCVLSGRGLCVGLITRLEESYRVWCVWVWSWSLEKWGGLGPQGAVEPLEKKIIYCNSGRGAAVGETSQFLVRWVLAILCRSQHMCLFSESREVLWVNVVNIGVVLRDLRLILCGEYINFTLELFSSVHEIWINYFQSQYLRNHYTLDVSGVVDLAFTSFIRHVLYSVRQVGRMGVYGFSPWRLGEMPQKSKGEMPHLNSFKSV
jgi:hypothetical protein